MLDTSGNSFLRSHPDIYTHSSYWDLGNHHSDMEVSELKGGSNLELFLIIIIIIIIIRCYLVNRNEFGMFLNCCPA